MLPMGLLLNYIIFGSSYVFDPSKLVWGSLLIFALLAVAFIFYGLVALALRNRFPNEKDLYKRLLISIGVFALLTAVIISLVLRGYELLKLWNYTYSEQDFTIAYIAFLVINIFLTFLNEGIYQFEKYRDTLKLNEELKKEYMQSQLLGLKSQMNPHFLFNSLNTLSSLIQENTETAEDFLDHMSKVYRYLLRNSEEKLVTLETELQFIRSYYFLLKKRHGDGLQLAIDVEEQYLQTLVPPLTLQMIVENILHQNAVDKKEPLCICIESNEENLCVANTLNLKKSSTERDHALENIKNKYRLLCQPGMKTVFEANRRIILLPVIKEPAICTE